MPRLKLSSEAKRARIEMAKQGMKPCTSCKEVLSLDNFGMAPGTARIRRKAMCLECEERNRNNQLPSAERKERNRKLAEHGMKHCTWCVEDLPLNAFQNKASSPDGAHSHCKECFSNQAFQWDNYWNADQNQNTQPEKGNPLDDIIDAHNNCTKSETLNNLSGTDPFEVEEVVGQLLNEMGLQNVKVTKRRKDGGIDIICERRNEPSGISELVIQVKRHGKKIGPSEVRDIRGAAGDRKEAFLITTSDFTKEAVKEANRTDAKKVTLMNGDELVEKFIEFQIGVCKETRTIYDFTGFKQSA